MCGILGASVNSISLSKEEFLNSNILMNHRGPDATGFYQSKTKKSYVGS